MNIKLYHWFTIKYFLYYFFKLYYDPLLIKLPDYNDDKMNIFFIIPDLTYFFLYNKFIKGFYTDIISYFQIM